MKLYFLKITLLFIPLLFIGDTTAWKVKTATITFKIKNAGVTIDGSFSGLKADIKFNPIKPEESSINASVESKTVNTGNDSRDNHLRKSDYFDVEKYPLILLQSTKIEKTGPITFNGTFILNIKGVSKFVIIPFTFMKLPEKTSFKGSFTINRRDYNVGSSSMILADDATISLDVEVTE